MDATSLERLCEKYRSERGAIIELLQTVQAEEYCLPRETLQQISRQLQIPLSQLYGLATFYRAFTLRPKGKHQVICCSGTACHVRGGKRVADQFARVLGIAVGETTEDGLFSLHTVNCLGACAVAPVAVIDGKCHGEMTAAKVERLVERYRREAGE